MSGLKRRIVFTFIAILLVAAWGVIESKRHDQLVHQTSQIVYAGGDTSWLATYVVSHLPLSPGLYNGVFTLNYRRPIPSNHPVVFIRFGTNNLSVTTSYVLSRDMTITSGYGNIQPNKSDKFIVTLEMMSKKYHFELLRIPAKSATQSGKY